MGYARPKSNARADLKLKKNSGLSSVKTAVVLETNTIPAQPFQGIYITDPKNVIIKDALAIEYTKMAVFKDYTAIYHIHTSHALYYPLFLLPVDILDSSQQWAYS